MNILRTPDDRFENLPEFPYTPHYVHIKDLRIHYVDEGQGSNIVCLHGEPTWSFVYRKIINALSPGHRVIAPDFLGFGRSDKPAETADHTLRLHVEMLVNFFDFMKLREVTLVVHDWGGLIGLAALERIASDVARLVIM